MDASHLPDADSAAADAESAAALLAALTALVASFTAVLFTAALLTAENAALTAFCASKRACWASNWSCAGSVGGSGLKIDVDDVDPGAADPRTFDEGGIVEGEKQKKKFIACLNKQTQGYYNTFACINE